MPHQCTGCGHVFPDGSKEMLSGCPDCGGNKFQFQPSGATGAEAGSAGADAGASDGAGDATPTPSEEPPDPPSPGGGVAETVAGAAQSVRKMVGADGSDRSTPDDAAPDREWPAVGREDATASRPTEDAAQAGARSETVSPDELPAHDEPGTDEERTDPVSTDGPAPRNADPEAESDPSVTDAGAEPGSAPFTGSGDRQDDATDSPDLSELRAELNDQFESIKIVERGQYELNLMELYDREEYIISLMEDGRYAIEVPETWRGES